MAEAEAACHYRLPLGTQRVADRPRGVTLIESPPMNTLPHSQGDEPTTAVPLPMLYNLVYCSRAAAEVDDAAVARIIATARRRNPALGITGLLVFGSGVFFQWLEGPRAQVQQLMALLRTDPRHDNVVALSESEEVRERMFPDWDMELVTADHIRDVLADALGNATDDHSAAVLTQLLAQLDAGPLAGLSDLADPADQAGRSDH